MNKAFEELVTTIGVDVSKLHQSMTLMDIYCYSCDLKYIAVNTDNETLVSACIKYSDVILAHLKQAKFEYYLSGIHAWEDTRNSNNIAIKFFGQYRASTVNWSVPFMY